MLFPYIILSLYHSFPFLEWRYPLYILCTWTNENMNEKTIIYQFERSLVKWSLKNWNFVKFKFGKGEIQQNLFQFWLDMSSLLNRFKTFYWLNMVSTPKLLINSIFWFNSPFIIASKMSEEDFKVVIIYVIIFPIKEDQTR